MANTDSQTVFPKLTNFVPPNDVSQNNLCFVNAAIQSLHALSGFSEYFININESNLAGKPVTREMVRVVKEGRLGTPLSLSQLRIKVGQSVGKVYNGEQEDSCEFLR